MRIRDARLADAAALTEIAVAAKRSWGYPDEWMRAWAGGLTIDAAALSAMRVRVAEDDSGPVGFFAIAGSGRSARLEHLWVRPDRMGAGVGRALVERAVREAAAAGADELLIESDPNAEPFYLRMGASRVGSTPAPAPGAPDRALPLLRVGLAPRG